jgi:hypothetical protein
MKNYMSPPIWLMLGVEWTEDEMREYARSVRNDNDDGSPAWFDPDDGHWSYQPDFPLATFPHHWIK